MTYCSITNQQITRLSHGSKRFLRELEHDDSNVRYNSPVHGIVNSAKGVYSELNNKKSMIIIFMQHNNRFDAYIRTVVVVL